MLSNIGIVYSRDIANANSVALELQAILDYKGYRSCFVTTDDFSDNISLAMVIGGDGTILKAARFYSALNIPIFGINLGRLGFLAQSKPEELDDIIEKIINEEYKIQERLMLYSNLPNFSALNDIVIKGSSNSRTTKFHLHINDKFLCNYLADGLIISTPTGSTAYNLSAGGPIVTPDLDVIIITPICPHTLNARPLVIPSKDVISVKTCEANTKFSVTFDGQIMKDLDCGAEITIKKCDRKSKLLVLNKENNGFYSVLRDKLHWGVEPAS